MTITASNLRSYAALPPSTVLPDTTLEQYITVANVIRTEDLDSSGLTDDRLDVIELNLAAHFAIIAQERGGLTEQQVGNSRERYRTMSDREYGLSSTRFGQVALSLDTTGTLNSLVTKPLAQFRVV